LKEPNKIFVADELGMIRVDRTLLPENLPLKDRTGVTAEVTINGHSETSAGNTLVPNRVRTRIVLVDNPRFDHDNADYLASTFSHYITVFNIRVEKEVDGVWQTIDEDNTVSTLKRTYKGVIVSNPNAAITSSNISDAFEIGRIVDCNIYSDKVYVRMQRPIVYTADEQAWDQVTKYPYISTSSYHRLLKNSLLKFYAEWDGSIIYGTVQAYNNCFGETPIMNTAIRLPEVTPVCDIADVKIDLRKGQSNLYGRLKVNELSYYYDTYIAPSAGSNRWEAGAKQTKDDYLSANKPLSIYMSKNFLGSEGLTVSNVLNEKFVLNSAYAGNELMVCAHPANQYWVGARYRSVCRYGLIEEAGVYYLVNFLTGAKTLVPEEELPTDFLN
jgi:hypothetical protein